MDPLKVYVSWDGDAIGQRVGRATISDDVEEVRRVDQAIQAGNEIWRNWALAQGGSIVEIGGDEGRVEVPASALADLPQICETYKTAVDATVSVGLGRKLSESAKALMAAKLRGKNRVVLYDQSVEQTLAEVKEKPEQQKIAEEYLNEFKKADGAGKGVTHAAAPSRQHVDHEEGEVATAGDRKPIETETSADVRDHLARAHGAAAAQEKKDRAAAARQSGDLDALRSQVAASLQAMQQQLPVMAQLKSAYPSTYQAVVGLMQSVIKMGQEIQKADDALEKAEDLEPAEPTELEAWAETWHDPLAKMQNTIEFPGLGVERRPDTPTVHTNQQHATRLGLIGATVRRKWQQENTVGDDPRAIAHRIAAPAMLGGHRAGTQKQMQTAMKRRSASPGDAGQVAPSGGGARPSFVLSTEMMDRSKGKSKAMAASNFDPKEEAATVKHEDFHHVINRIDERYGQGAGKAAAGWLVHQIPKEHLSLLLNFGTRHFKYKLTNPAIYEETVALLHNYLNNPTLRRSFQNNRRVQTELANGKAMTPEESAAHARTIDQMMKQAYHGVRRAAASLTPERLQQIVKQRSSYGWTKAELAEIDKGLLSETEREPDEAPAKPPVLDKGAMATHAPERMVSLPVGTTHNGKIKVQHADGSSSWKGVRAGMVQALEADAPGVGQNSHPVSSREPGSR